MPDPIGPEAILAKKKQYLIPCVYHFYRSPPQIVRGAGVFLFDPTGKRYVDLYAGVSVHALGHCHPELVEVICNQVRTLQHTTTIYLTEPLVNLAEALAAVLPGDLCRSFFCASGSEANEGAALLASLHTGRHEFLALQHGLHGRTKLGMSLTGLSFWRTDPCPVGGITHVAGADCQACPWGRTFGTCDYACIDAVEEAIQTGTSGHPAALFAEPIQGNGGIRIPPAGYFQRLRRLLDRYNMLLIADEVQTGFGRTGRFWGLDHWHTVPDILTGGKALGGGTPIGFFATTDAIAASYTRPGAATFGGNPVTAVAAQTVLRILQRDDLPARAERLGQCLRDRLQTCMDKNPRISDIRGKGLMVGVEIRDASSAEAAASTDRILEAMKDAGYLLGKTGPGRNVLTWMPPLIIAEETLMESVDAFEAVLATA